ncbi:ATP cone domain-containing protein [Deinococcus sp. VB343]|uniref:ATP cone domain-containing protein n=1 Tax=Deinococcus sp. VB343 TaxID=3385567 RepID=UPI0039C9F116
MPPELSLGTAQQAWPFSRGLVAESLMNAGASAEQARAASRRIEQHLRATKRTLFSPDEVQALMVETAQDMLGEEVAAAVSEQIPAFVDILVTAKRGQLPFSRGVLARTLEDTSLSGREAYSAASAVDLELRRRGLREISVSALDELTEGVLAQLYGEQQRLNYRYLQQNRGKLGVVSAEGETPVPFSKGLLVQSMLAAGVAPDVARKIARVTQRDLRGSEDRVVRRLQIREKVEALLREEVGPDVSARYRLLRVIRTPPRPLIVLLGGVSGTGKSFLAAEIAYRLGISRVVSTDSIREVMRAMVSPALLPTLHASTFNAWEALVPPGQTRPPHPTREELLAGLRDQVQQVSVGLGAVVNRSIQEGTSLVLEGVHLVPGYLNASGYSGALLVPMLVTLPDEQEHRRHFESRDAETAAGRPLHRYMRYFDEIRTMQDELQQLARRHNVPLLDALTLDESADQAVEMVLRQVMVALTPEEREAALGEDTAMNLLT